MNNERTERIADGIRDYLATDAIHNEPESTGLSKRLQWSFYPETPEQLAEAWLLTGLGRTKGEWTEAASTSARWVQVTAGPMLNYIELTIFAPAGWGSEVPPGPVLVGLNERRELEITSILG